MQTFEAPTAPTAANQNAAGVWHYGCSQGCGGGAGAAGNCPNCGSLLAHNQAFHANTNNNTQTTPTPPPTEPSQNAAGVWHYTCANACAGGSGSATACATCGNTLAHNTAYHQ